MVSSLTSFTSLLSYILIVSLVAVVSLLNTSTYSGQLLPAKDDSKQYGLKQCPDSSAYLKWHLVVLCLAYLTQTNLSFLMYFAESASKNTLGFPVALQASAI